MASKYKMLMGGIGDDAHFIGLRLLEFGFAEFGYEVINIGIRNTLDDFFRRASEFEIIMISCKNGHAALYLERFAEKLSKFKLTHDEPKMWYLGGSLSVSENNDRVKKYYLDMGFTNVYPKPTFLVEIANDIEQNLFRYDVKPRDGTIKSISKTVLEQEPYQGIINSAISWDKLRDARKNLFEQLNLNPGLAYEDFKSPPGLLLDRCLASSTHNGKIPLLQPRTGVADIHQQTEILVFLEGEGSDVSSTQLDAASRSKFYDKSKEGILKSRELGYSVLNGFPLQSYEIDELRKMTAALKTPFQLRAGGPDHRYTYEIALRGGASGLEGGFLCYLMPYDKETTPFESLSNWQYVDRVCALYARQTGVEINREYFGTLTASLIEPSLAIVVNIIQALLSAQQGIRSFSIGYAEQGNRIQDIAAMRILREMVSHYLRKSGYSNFQVSTVFHQYMSAFSEDPMKAEELIYNSAVTGSLAKATRIITKTIVEAIKIPDKLDNARSLKICRKGIGASKNCEINQPKLQQEMILLRSEVSQLMDAISQLGNGNIAFGAIKAIETGVVDIPFSPNVYNNNEVVTLRDADGAVRFQNFGRLPFSESVKEFHFNKISYRKIIERDHNLFSLLEKDLTRIWKGDYKHWPLDDHYVR